jgi:ArsR family transcriptional regulator, arsenate/arsenite/antimonite-responsive transcriptional repressor
MAEERVRRTLEITPLVSLCGGALLAPLPRERAEELASLLRAVSDPVRLQLLSLIISATPQEACVCDLTDAVDLSQPTVSHHLKVLTEAGLVTRQRRGSWAWFSIVPGRLADIASIFEVGN